MPGDTRSCPASSWSGSSWRRTLTARHEACRGPQARHSCLHGLLQGHGGAEARRGVHQHARRHPRPVRHPRDAARLPRVHGEAHREDGGRGGGGGPCRAGDEPQAGDRLHPARAPRMDEVHRAGPDPGQAADHAHEPQPAELRPRVGGAQVIHRPGAAHRGLRRALRGRDVPDDAREARPGPGHRGPGLGGDRPGRRATTARCRSCSRTSPWAGTRWAGAP